MHSPTQPVTTHTHAQLRDVVFAAIDELNGQRPPDQQLDKALETPLAGQDGPLDSLAFVNFIVALEQQFERTFGIAVSLLDDDRLDPTAGQFSSVGALIAFLDTLRTPGSDD